MDNQMPMRVFGMNDNNIAAAIEGAQIGTLVTA
jgi:hypothetical protein